MTGYKVVFYYKDEPSYKGSFNIEADNECVANKLVRLMVDTKSDLIPGNWDYWRIEAHENIKERN